MWLLTSKQSSDIVGEGQNTVGVGQALSTAWQGVRVKLHDCQIKYTGKTKKGVTEYRQTQFEFNLGYVLIKEQRSFKKGNKQWTNQDKKSN